jgi:hypothetical protein
MEQLQLETPGNVMEQLNPNALAKLPVDLFKALMWELPYEDIKVLCRTDKRAARICNDDNFWRQKSANDFQTVSNVIPLNFPTWKKFYQYVYPLSNMLFTREELSKFDQLQDIIRDNIVNHATLVDGVYYWNFDVSESFDFALDLANDSIDALIGELPIHIVVPASLRDIHYTDDQAEQGYWFDRLISYKGYSLEGVGEGIFSLPFPMYRDLYNYIAFKLNKPTLIEQMQTENDDIHNRFKNLYIPVYDTIDNYSPVPLPDFVIPAGQMPELDRYYDLTTSRREQIIPYKSRQEYEVERRAAEPKYTYHTVEGNININWSIPQIVAAIKASIGWNRQSGISYVHYIRDTNTFFYFQPDPNGDLTSADIGPLIDNSDRLFYL